eukprot:gene30302-37494_t
MHLYTRSVHVKNDASISAAIRFATEVCAYVNKTYSTKMRFGIEAFGHAKVHWFMDFDSVDQSLAMHQKMLLDHDFQSLLGKGKDLPFGEDGAMNLSSLCQRDILSVSSEASVQKAAELMRVNHVGALALTDPEDPARVVGVVTDRDLVVNLLAQGRLPGELPVGAYSHAQLIGVPGSATVHEAIAAMHKHGVRRVFVTEPNGRLLGLLSLDDVLKTLAEDLSGLSQALRMGIDLENTRTSPMFNPNELGGNMYLAQHEP